MKKIIWNNRYSDTDEPDSHGRWARVGYLEHKNDNSLENCLIAWINKINDKFHVYVYLGAGEHKKDFKRLDDAKEYCVTVINSFYDNYLKD